MTLGCAGVWADPARSEEAITAMIGFSSELHRYGTGIYYNEADYYLDDWKVIYLLHKNTSIFLKMYMCIMKKYNIILR